MVEVPDAPARIWAGDTAPADIEKSGTAAGFTVIERLVVWLAPPPEAVMVMVAVPVVAVTVAVNETVTVQVGVQGLFPNVAVTPDGRPLVENVTDEAVPLTSVAVIEDVELVCPWTTVRLLGEGLLRLKSKAAATVRERVVV